MPSRDHDAKMLVTTDGKGQSPTMGGADDIALLQDVAGNADLAASFRLTKEKVRKKF